MTTGEADPRGRLIVALDVPDLAHSEKLIDQLGNSVSFYKIGHQLGFAGGLSLARDLAQDGVNVFLDMKLLDIDNTVSKGVESIAKLGVSMLTIHAYPKAMRAAVEAAKGSGLTLLGVTVLTSMDDGDLKAAGYASSASQLVEIRAKDAMEAGMGGVVASALEAEHIRQIIGHEMAIVTPGIRPAGVEHGDQKRIMTPAKAITAGASHLVVGRPIIGAQDPRKAAEEILSDIKGAHAGKPG